MFSLPFFRKVAIAEGISYLLFALTMPLKYQFDILWPNKIVGYAHGVLFILYIVNLLLLQQEIKWKMKTFLFLGFASLLPFATFAADKYILSKQKA